MAQKLLHKRSIKLNSAPIYAESDPQIEIGEIAINYNSENPFLSILAQKTEENGITPINDYEVVRFSADKVLDTRYADIESLNEINKSVEEIQKEIEDGKALILDMTKVAPKNPGVNDYLQYAIYEIQAGIPETMTYEEFLNAIVNNDKSVIIKHDIYGHWDNLFPHRKAYGEIEDYGYMVVFQYLTSLSNDLGTYVSLTVTFAPDGVQMSWEARTFLTNADVNNYLSLESSSPVQNKVVTAELNKKVDIDTFNGELDKKADKSELEALPTKYDLHEIYYVPEDFFEEYYETPEADGAFALVKSNYINEIIENGYTVAVKDSQKLEIKHNEQYIMFDMIDGNDSDGVSINSIERLKIKKDTYKAYGNFVLLYNPFYIVTSDGSLSDTDGFKQYEFVRQVIADNSQLPEENKQLFKKNMGSFADWNAQEGDAGYIENRTHYVTGTTETINLNGEYEIIKTNINVNDDSIIDISWNIDFMDSYTAGSCRFTGNDASDYYSFDNGGFNIELQNHGGLIDLYMYAFGGGESHYGTVTIDVDFECKTLDEVYIPDTIARKSDIVTPNWNAQKGEAGYIENKPFGFDNIQKTITSNGNGDAIDGWTSVIAFYEYEFESFSTKEPNVVRFNFITDKTREFPTQLDFYIPYYNFYDSKINDTFNISDDVYILTEHDNYYGRYWSIYFYCGNDTHELKIDFCDLTRIDEKFIPNTVLKTTPQTLSDTNKNQALANLGLLDVVTVINNMPIVKGDAENSAVLKGEYEGYSNKAISQVSVSLGAASTSGLKGWYYSKIEFGSTPIITLSDKQPSVFLGYLSGGEWSSGTPNIKVGDKVSIVNNSKYDYCGEVKSISSNKVTLKSALPFDSLDTGLVSLNHPDDWSIYLPDNESAGIIDFGGGALAEGVNTKATNIGSHAEGIQTHAYGQYSHTEGFKTSAGYAAHAEGKETVAKGLCSHAEGSETQAIGDGSHAEGRSTQSEGKDSHAEGRTTKAIGANSHAEGQNSEARKNNSHAEGQATIADGDASHSEGRESNASGNYSHAEGRQTTASNNNAHAEGQATIASGHTSHAEGWKCIAGKSDTAPVVNTNVDAGNYTHAEGNGTWALGNSSHAEGKGTIANNTAEHASGQYNNSIAKTDSNTTAEATHFSIGIGTSDTDRKNAFEVKQNGDIYIEGVDGRIQDKLDKLVNITYSELKSLRDNSQLVVGQQYRITDYMTTTTQENTQSAGHQFDIIVTADDVNVLNEKARAIQHEGDTYFANSNLNAWEIWYCLDNDTDRFVWADDSESGRGVIYRMIDEFGNECPYDFKNIMFKRWKLNAPETVDYESWLEQLSTNIQNEFSNNILSYIWGSLDGSVRYWETEFGEVYSAPTGDSNYFYTFSNIISDVVSDKSLNTNGKYCYRNVIKECINGLNNIIFFNTSTTSICHSNYFGNSCSNNNFGERCYSNSFGDSCYDNSFGNDCCYNTFGNSCSNNSFGNFCSNNSFGNEYYSNSFGNFCSNNSFGNSCSNNSFGNEYYSNSFGEGCYYNSFGEDCYSNSFGNSCSNNSFGEGCYYNSFGEGCYSNSFGEGCYYNSFGNSCGANKFGNECYENSFGNECYYNSFGNECDNISLNRYCKANSFGNLCSFIYFYIKKGGNIDYVNNVHCGDNCHLTLIVDTDIVGTINSTNSIKNINVAQGLSNIDRGDIELTTTGQDYEIKVARNSAGDIKVFCLADLIA